MRTTRIITSVLLGGILATAGACKNKSDEASKARETAAKKVTEAEEARREAEVKEAEARRDAEARLVKDRADIRDRLRKDVDAADRKVAHLREKMADAKGAARKNAEAAAHEVELRKAKVDAGLERFGNVAAADLEASKIQLEADIAALNKAVDGFDDTLD